MYLVDHFYLRLIGSVIVGVYWIALEFLTHNLAFLVVGGYSFIFVEQTLELIINQLFPTKNLTLAIASCMVSSIDYFLAPKILFISL